MREPLSKMCAKVSRGIVRATRIQHKKKHSKSIPISINFRLFPILNFNCVVIGYNEFDGNLLKWNYYKINVKSVCLSIGVEFSIGCLLFCCIFRYCFGWSNCIVVSAINACCYGICEGLQLLYLKTPEWYIVWGCKCIGQGLWKILSNGHQISMHVLPSWGSNYETRNLAADSFTVWNRLSSGSVVGNSKVSD